MGADEDLERYSYVGRGWKFLVRTIDSHITWFRETIVEPNRKEYYWYHEKIRRVPTVDECYDNDFVCRYEADVQFIMDKKVDMNIVNILKTRYERCTLDFPFDHKVKCKEVHEVWQNALTNFFIKYGDLGVEKALSCYMKQKHRMAWERRHGPVGSGKKPVEELKPPKEKTC